MDILQKIVENKKEELLIRKLMVPVEDIINSRFFERDCISLKKNILNSKSGIIAEFKRKSPSKGFINRTADISTITAAYKKYGAAGLSVLTDNLFFGGNSDDIGVAREADLPVLRKEFIIDSYQVLTTKALGADAILLIAAILTRDEVKSFASSAKALGLEVVLEIHEESELGHICTDIDIIGINNRNLKTFDVDINNSISLVKKLSSDIPVISESGIDNTDDIIELRKCGFAGFLIGEAFMKNADPGTAFQEFINELNSKL